MNKVKLTDQKDCSMSLEELWADLSQLTAHIVQDNELCVDKVYPIGIRELQLTSIKTLLSAIEEHHK